MIPGRSERRRAAPSDLFYRSVRVLTMFTLVLAALAYMAITWRWQLTADGPVMHYVVFLMHHGFRPYTEITDNNMPGAYLTEAAAMRLFGSGDLAWRIYEFFLLGLMAAAMAYLSRGVDRVAGLFAAGIFVAMHAAEGPQFAAERELVITVCLLLALAAMEASLARRWPPLMGIAGFAAGVAANIKPTFLLFGGLALLCAGVLGRRRPQGAWPYLLWSAGGLLVTGAIALGFLLHFHALGGFLFVLTRVIPAYAGMAPPGLLHLLRSAMPRSLTVLALWTLPLVVWNWRRVGAWPWTRYVLAATSLLGLLSFLAQRKGFPHHRYTFLSLLLLLIAMELFAALRQPGLPRLWAALAILVMLFGFIPRSLRTARAIPDQTEFYTALRGDLDALGGPATLQHKVFCLDLIYGCLNALYHDGIVENAGFTGDLLLFVPNGNFATSYYRRLFTEQLDRDPPAVLVVSNESLMEDNTFNRLQRWPRFADYLAAHYTEVVEREFAHNKFGVYETDFLHPSERDAYRIYVADGSPLLPRARALPAPRP